MNVAELFRKIARRIADWTGSASAFLLMLGIVIIWAFCGPYFHYSDAWQLVINTGTSVVTFLMVFLIQNSQNRESKILHLKIAELIRADRKARNQMIDLEQYTDQQLEDLHDEFRDLKNETDRLEELVRIKRAQRSSPALKDQP